MKSCDVYSKFLKGNGFIRVFPTKRNTPNFKLKCRVLRKSYPFMLASAMGIMGCQFSGDTNRKSDVQEELVGVSLDKLYEDVVDKYNLDKLKEKEPLPKNMIESIMKSENVPYLADVNYNHMPENLDNFWGMVRNGVKYSVVDVVNSKNLNKEQIKKYEIMAYKMLSQISRFKGSIEKVDLEDYNNLKAFAYFEKVMKYKDDYKNVFYKDDGVYNAFSEIYGRYYKDYFEFYKKSSQYPQIEEFALEFYKCDYKDWILAGKDSAFYNAESYKILDKWLKRQEIDKKGVCYFSPVDDNVYCNAVANYYRRGKDLEVVLEVDPRGNLGDGYYSPVGEVIIHELMHVMQMKPSSPESSEDNRILSESAYIDKRFEQSDGYISELGPSFMSLAIDDYLYKLRHNIEQEKVVDYGSFKVRGKEIKLGELAVWFREKLEKTKDNDFGRLSIDKMLNSPEVFGELKAISSGYKINSKIYDTRTR